METFRAYSFAQDAHGVFGAEMSLGAIVEEVELGKRRCHLVMKCEISVP